MSCDETIEAIPLGDATDLGLMGNTNKSEDEAGLEQRNDDSCVYVRHKLRA